MSALRMLLLWAVLVQHAVAADIHVFAAASLTDALREVAAAYEKTNSHKLRFNFGASSLLARQIQEGAPADLFFSADEEKMDLMAKQDLLVPGTRKKLLSNSLVIVLPVEGSLKIEKPEDLKKARRIALAETKTVPAGIYARRFLEQRGLLNGLRSSVIPTENVRAALAAVESGNVDAAMVYKTDAALSTRVKIALEIPAASTPDISYPAAVVKGGKQSSLAKNFLEYLQSPPARSIFERHGFVVIR